MWSELSIFIILMILTGLKHIEAILKQIKPFQTIFYGL